MAKRGQKFELDPDAPDFLFNALHDEDESAVNQGPLIKDVQEHEIDNVPPPPRFKQTATGFPEPKTRRKPSAFKQIQNPSLRDSSQATRTKSLPKYEPSDQAIAHHIRKKHGYDFESQQKADIDKENKQRIADMSIDEIAEARAELMSQLNPSFVEKLLRRANIEEDEERERQNNAAFEATPTTQLLNTRQATDSQTPQHTSSIHFPLPPNNPSDYQPLDPNSSTFLDDLKTHYFPHTPHDPSTLSWLQDPDESSLEASPYNPTKATYSASDLRFSFTGTLIPPKESLALPTSLGLHHHGQAPESAGYTIPELALLSRSTLPNQRCIAYQTIGRILYRLGRGDFTKQSNTKELTDALWDTVEKERMVEVMMAEANRKEKGNVHVSAQAYATEALWLWRKGCGGERGLLRPGERRAM